MQRRARTLVTVVFAIVTIAAIGFAVHLSLDSGNYFYYWPEDRAKWVYPLGSVVFVCFCMLAEAVLTWAVLVASRPKALWLRCLAGLVLLGPWAVASTMLAIHTEIFTKRAS